MQIKFLQIFCIVFLVSPSFVNAQEDTLTVFQRHFTDSDGLPQNSVKAIAKDIEGFLWLTTENGLVRFDGNHFYNWSKQIPGLYSSRFSAIFPDCLTGTLGAFNASGEALQIAAGKANINRQLLAATVKRLSVVPWLNWVTRQNAQGPRLPIHDNGVYYNGVDSVAFVGCDRLYAITGKKLLVYTNTSVDSTILTNRSWKDLFLWNDSLYAWHGKDSIDLIDGKQHLSLPMEGPLAGKTMQPYHIYRTEQQGFPHIVCIGNNWYSLKKEGQKFTSRLLLRGFSREVNRVVSAFYDPALNRLFMGSSTDGLFEFSFPDFHVLTTRNAELDNVYYAQTMYGNDRILTAQGHIINLPQHHINKAATSRFANTDKYSILQDQLGNIWTKEAKMLIRLEPEALRESGRWQMEGYITNLYLSGDRFYIGTQNREIFTLSTNQSVIHPELLLHLPAIPTYFQQIGDWLWVASEKGLYKVNLNKRVAEAVTGLENIYIRSIYVASDQEIWISTYENGFYLLQDKKLTRFPSDKEGALLTTHCMVDDRKGYLWISTNKGLFQASKTDLLRYAEGSQSQVYYQYYTTVDGLYTNEFNGGCQPCGLLLPDGWISLPSMNGLVWFNPDQVSKAMPDKGIFIDNILVDGRRVDWNDTITISRFAQQVKISVSTPYWNNTKNVEWQYALLSAGDTTWLEPDNSLISLSSLPSGMQQLLIRKMNGFGKDNFTYHSFTLNIPYAWYLHPLALLLWGLAALILVWLSIRLRTRYIALQNRQLEKKVTEKTRALQNALGELELSEKALARRTALQEKIIASVSHDVRAPMAYLQIVTDEIRKGIEAEGNKRFSNAMQLTSDQFGRLYIFLDNLLQYVKTLNRSGEITKQDFSLNELVAEKMVFFQPFALRKNIQIVNHTKPEHSICSNRLLSSILLHNLLDNALKVSARGTVTIDAQKQGEFLVLTISDSGPGFPSSILQWINSDEDESREHEDLFRGMGLYIVKDLARILRIQILALNTENGAVVTLKFYQIMPYQA